MSEAAPFKCSAVLKSNFFYRFFLSSFLVLFTTCHMFGLFSLMSLLLLNNIVLVYKTFDLKYTCSIIFYLYNLRYRLKGYGSIRKGYSVKQGQEEWALSPALYWKRSTNKFSVRNMFLMHVLG